MVPEKVDGDLTVEATDILVEVRDRNLNRVGQIRPEDMNLKVQELANDIGTWSLSLPVEHPLVPTLTTPGSGIIVYGGPSNRMVQVEDGTYVNEGTFFGRRSLIFSGPVTTIDFVESDTDVRGSVNFSGVSDNAYLWDALAYPEPGNPDAMTQTKVRDARTGTAEALLHYFVNANIGPGAPAARRKAGLTMGYNGGRGPILTKSTRFFTLGDMCTAIAVQADLGFGIRHYGGNNLVFETWQQRDRSRMIRLDIENGQLAKSEVAITVPGVTYVVVAGRYTDYSRAFYSGSNATAEAAQAMWGRRIERWVDQRASDNPAEYADKQTEILAKDGFTGVQVKALPDSEMLFAYGDEWFVGDTICVMVSDVEYFSQVTGVVLQAGPGGVTFGIILGDTAAWSPEAARLARIRDVEGRLNYLEQADDMTLNTPTSENDGGDVPTEPPPTPDLTGDTWAEYTDANGTSLPDYLSSYGGGGGGGIGGGGGGGGGSVVVVNYDLAWPARPDAQTVIWTGPVGAGPPQIVAGAAQPGDHWVSFVESAA